jgi:hypothetical protein
VFFAIITKPLQARRRAIIRSTWLHCMRAEAEAAGITLRHRFFVGQPTRFDRAEPGFATAGADLAAELAAHGDVVPLRMQERYDNLTLKSQLALHWVAREWAAVGGVDAPLYAEGAEAGDARYGGATASQLDGMDAVTAAALPDAWAAARPGAGPPPARPWGDAFAGVGHPAPPLHWLVKVDADVHFCPGHLLAYGASLLAPPKGAPAGPQYVWAGKGPYGNRSIIRCVCGVLCVCVCVCVCVTCFV